MKAVDTISGVSKKQLEIFLKKSESERFHIGNELNDFGRKIMVSSIRSEYPGISEIEIKAEIFRRCYSGFFNADQLARIIFSMKKYLQENEATFRDKSLDPTP